LDERQDTGRIYKNAGGRILGVDPSTFEEHVEKAERKLRPGGNLFEARKVLDRARQDQDRFPLTEWQADQLVGPSAPRGRSVKLSGLEAKPDRVKVKGRRIQPHDAARDYDGKPRSDQ